MRKSVILSTIKRKSNILYYINLIMLKKYALKKCKKNFKQVKGIEGCIFKLSLTIFLKFFLYFALLGGFSSEIQLDKFLNVCSFLFIPELLLFDFSKIFELGILKIVSIFLLIFSANLITIISFLEKITSWLKNKKIYS